MQKAHLATALLILLLPLPALAHSPKQGDIWASAGPFVTQTQGRIDGVATPTWTGGVVAEGDVDYNGGVEIAMLYVDKLYARRRNADKVVERIKRMYITTGYRHWLKPWFSAAGAFYSAYSMGDPKVVFDDRPSGDPLETTARDVTEYGFDTSLTWEIWNADDFAMTADARYSWSASRKSHENADTIGVMVGVKWLVPKAGP